MSPTSRMNANGSESGVLPQDALPQDALPQVALLGTGGTIAGVADTPLEQISYQAGVLSVECMLESLPGIEGVARIASRQCGNLPSEDMRPCHWAKLGRDCAQALEDETMCGVVLTHGTDTLEESAFYLHLTMNSSKPVVLTGAMRPATSLSADGPINIRDAVAVAASPQARARGALIVINGRIISARTAVKAGTLDVEAFRALESGLLGRVINGQPVFYHSGEDGPVLAGTYAAHAGQDNLPRVDVLYACAGMPLDATLFALERSSGLVVAGMGNGSMPSDIRTALNLAVREGKPVVRASRTGGAPVTDLEEYAAFIASGMLSTPKARVLLMLALAEAERQGVRDPEARVASVRRAFTHCREV